jgi:hypothetical protein
MDSRPTGYRGAAGSAPAEAVPSDEDAARALAAWLLESAAENGDDADRARARLATVSPRVSDLVADELVRAMETRPLDVCGVFSNHTIPLWFESSRDKLIAGLTAATARAPSCATFAAFLRTIPVRRASVENAGFLGRARSVLGRPWVIAFVWLPASAALFMAFFVDGLAQLAVGGVIAVLFGLAFGVEAFVRRCPSCRRLFAAMPTSMVHAGSHTERVTVATPGGGATTIDRTVDSYGTLWRCVHCKHVWSR